MVRLSVIDDSLHGRRRLVIVRIGRSGQEDLAGSDRVQLDGVLKPTLFPVRLWPRTRR
jgi:hypothetical protein